MAATARRIHSGLNNENVLTVQAIDTNSIADDANWVITVPAGMIGEGWIPCGVSVAVPDNAALNAGARVWTLLDSVGEAGTPVGVDLVSYSEVNGHLTIVNRSGAAVQNAVITAFFVAAPKASAIP